MVAKEVSTPLALMKGQRPLLFIPWSCFALSARALWMLFNLHHRGFEVRG
jgi:hypothetical protein